MKRLQSVKSSKGFSQARKGPDTKMMGEFDSSRLGMDEFVEQRIKLLKIARFWDER